MVFRGDLEGRRSRAARKDDALRKRKTGLFDIVKRDATEPGGMLASILPGEATRARPAADVVRCRLASRAALPHPPLLITMK